MEERLQQLDHYQHFTYNDDLYVVYEKYSYHNKDKYSIVSTYNLSKHKVIELPISTMVKPVDVEVNIINNSERRKTMWANPENMPKGKLILILLIVMIISAIVYNVI